MADLESEYGKIKSNLRSQGEAAKSAARRRIEQKFGNRLNSGASGKLILEQDQNIDQSLEGQMGAIDLEQAKSAREERLLKQGQEFQKGERLGSQEFAGSQAELGRGFQTSERLGSQSFASGEAAIGRGFQTSERLGSQGFASGEQEKQRGFATGERLGAQEFQAGQSSLDRALQERGVTLAEKQFGEQVRQYNQEYQQNLATNLFNKILALNTAKIDTEDLSKLAVDFGYQRDVGKAGSKGYATGEGLAGFAKTLGLPEKSKYTSYFSV